MAGTSSYMAASSAMQGVAGLGGAIAQSNAQQAMGDYNKRIGEMNSKLANFNADDAIKRGDKNAENLQKKTQSMIGAQRADFGAQGIDVNNDSAASIQSDTAAMGALDALTIKNNAWREAWGYKIQGNNAANAGAFAQMSGQSQSQQTLLTGGMNAIGSGLNAAYWAKKDG